MWVFLCFRFQIAESDILGLDNVTYSKLSDSGFRCRYFHIALVDRASLDIRGTSDRNVRTIKIHWLCVDWVCHTSLYAFAFQYNPGYILAYLPRRYIFCQQQKNHLFKWTSSSTTYHSASPRHFQLRTVWRPLVCAEQAHQVQKHSKTYHSSATKWSGCVLRTLWSQARHLPFQLPWRFPSSTGWSCFLDW